MVSAFPANQAFAERQSEAGATASSQGGARVGGRSDREKFPFSLNEAKRAEMSE
jgi:hypothetical protein